MNDPLDELDALMAELGVVQTSARNDLDRYREFRDVFLGTDVGKRVLHDILSWGHVWASSVVRENSHMTFVYEGERKLALKVLTAIHMEPRLQPREQRSPLATKTEGE